MKDSLKVILYQLIYYLVRLVPTRREPRHLLLVKTDEIGDYILVRNHLSLFKETTSPYKDYKITFVGNILFKPLFDLYDSRVADDVIWLDKKKFRADLRYRYNILRQIRKVPASDAISLVYSRFWRKDDVIIAVSPATTRTAMESDSRLIPSYERRLTPGNIYTRLEDSGPETLFDAIRNARYIERLVGSSARTVKTSIDVRSDVRSFSLPTPYFVVFPGSGVPEKKWPAARFAEVTRHLARRYDLMPVVCGSGGDRADCAEFIREYAAPVLDLTGRTSLPQLLGVLHGAVCLISVDTGSVHLAAAVGCPVYALYSGLHYGRFAPYPAGISGNFHAVYPDSFEEMVKDSGGAVDYELIPIDLLKNIPAAKLIATIDASSLINSKQREGTI